jgi:ABC-type transport system involved in multi-copper enzyme maturation permease subunit
MLAHIASFELRRQLAGHVFWVVGAISIIMVLGSVSVDALRAGVDVNGLRNGAEAVVQTHLVWTLFFMFTTAAFVADAVLRDELVGFAPLMQALPVRWLDLVYGRFAGAFTAVLLCYLSVPLGIIVGSAMPWVAQGSVGSTPLDAIGFAFGVMAVPNLLLSATVGFAFATVARSMGAALVGAIILLIAYGWGARSGASLPPIFEPFGFAAYAEAISGWTMEARDAHVPAVEGALLVNRLLVLTASVLLLLLAGLRPRSTSAWTADRRLVALGNATRSAPIPRVQVKPHLDRWTSLRQGAYRLRFEFDQVVRTPVFAALLLLGLANAFATIWPLRLEADPSSLVRALSGATQLAPIVVALFFAGELRWREKELGVGDLLGAMPTKPAAYLLPKFAALAAILLTLVLATGLATLLPLILAARVGAGALLPAWMLSAAYDTLVFAALAMFLQALAPNKISGWGLTILDDAELRYGRYPGWPLPASVSGVASTWPWRLGWGLIAALLLALSLRSIVSRGPPADR